MKNKHFLIPIIVFAIFLSAFFVSVPPGLTQSEGDWTDPINLSNSGSSADPLIVTGTDGVIHVIWIDEFDGYKYVQSPDGVNWTDPKTVRFPFSPEASLPRFEVTSNGAIHAFWIDVENRLNYTNVSQISMDSPVSWRSSVRLGESVVDYDVAVDDDDGLHVSFIKNNSPDNETAGVYYRRSTNEGISWFAVQQLFESPYFRSLTVEDAHIRIAVLDDADIEKVYVTWDDPSLKRISMSISSGGGQEWSAPFEIIGADTSLNGRFETPYGIEIVTFNKKVLLTWQTGGAGSACFQFSRWSDDERDLWGETVRTFDESGFCPERIEFNNVNDDYIIAILKVDDALSLAAWDGNVWSRTQPQSDLFSFINSVTVEPLLLQCLNFSFQSERIFVVGCDKGESKDVWVAWRSLGLLDDWYPLPSSWSLPHLIINSPDRISSVSSVSDTDNTIHAVWVQSSAALQSDVDKSIYYASWNNEIWSRPSQMLINVDGAPGNLSLATDNTVDKLYLVWVDESNGNLLFSWAASDRASMPREWSSPMILPAPSSLIDSPEILVDGAGSLIVSYAVTFNEKRGIYLVRSDDLGASWSEPLSVFDASIADWDLVNRPRLVLSPANTLHVLFDQYASLSNVQQSQGVYYSRSSDGGVTWAPLVNVSEQSVQWSDMLVFGNMLHRLWQEKENSVISTFHQVSQDDGITWETISKLPSDGDVISNPTAVLDTDGKIHLMQIVQKQDAPLLQELIWDDGRWSIGEMRKLSLKYDTLGDLESGSFAGEGIYALLHFETTVDGKTETEFLSTTRILDVAVDAQPFDLGVVPTSKNKDFSVETPFLNDVAATQVSPLVNFDETEQPTISKNSAGIILILLVAVLTILVVMPRKKQ